MAVSVELNDEYMYYRNVFRKIVDQKLTDEEISTYDDLIDIADDIMDVTQDRLDNCEELLDKIVRKLIDYERSETKDENKLIKELHGAMLDYAYHKYRY